MKPSDLDEISKLVRELDRKVPKEGAAVELKQHGGGPDESKVTANRLGYLRLGIEFLRAAFTQTSKKDPNVIQVDLRYLLLDDSDVGFDWFERREDMKARQVEKSSWVPGFAGVCLALVIAVCIVFAVIGAVSVFKWLFEI